MNAIKLLKPRNIDGTRRGVGEVLKVGEDISAVLAATHVKLGNAEEAAEKKPAKKKAKK